MKKKRKQKQQKLIVILCVAVIVLLIVVIAAMLLAVRGSRKNTPVETTAPAVTAEVEETTEPTTVPTEETTEATEPPVTEPVMQKDMVPYYEKNSELAGWIWINDTKLNYPVMYTPGDPEKYLHLDFDGNYNVGGLPFIDSDCSLDPESDNLIIYGHNMLNGTQFRTLMSYDQKAFWEKHPVIQYSDLYENRTYEILACFYDRVYYKYEDVFKFYQFIDAKDEADFDNAIANYKEKALYDTGVTAEYGDHLITLVTCAYHVENGRFVVVAKLVEDDPQ